uniref:EBF1 protein n=1 Tax=Fopius arisanus TaxID=64838 RepID=A0A0C9PYC4_9HYME
MSIKSSFLVCKQWQNVLQNFWKSTRVLDITRKSPLNWGIPPRTLRERLTAPSLIRILKNCGEGLHTINSSDNSGLSYVIIEKAGELCPNLETVVLKSCSWPSLHIHKSLVACKITQFAINNAQDEAFLSNIFAQLNNLRYVEIHGNPTHCSIGSCILKLSKTIEVIRLSHIRISESIFNSAIQTLPNLRSLELNTCSNVNEDSFEKITYINSLKYLKIHGFHLVNNLSSSLQLIKNLSNLEVLEITTMNKESLRNISTVGIPAVACKFMWRDVNIFDDLFIEIAKNCRHLRSLDISGSSFVTDRGLNALASYTNLERLIINYVPEVSDDCLAKFHSLKILQCVGCEDVRDEGIIFLLQNARELQVLDVSLTSIGDRTLEAAIDAVAEEGREGASYASSVIPLPFS